MDGERTQETIIEKKGSPLDSCLLGCNLFHSFPSRCDTDTQPLPLPAFGILRNRILFLVGINSYEHSMGAFRYWFGVYKCVRRIILNSPYQRRGGVRCGYVSSQNDYLGAVEPAKSRTIPLFFSLNNHFRFFRGGDCFWENHKKRKSLMFRVVNDRAPCDVRLSPRSATSCCVSRGCFVISVGEREKDSPRCAWVNTKAHTKVYCSFFEWRGTVGVLNVLVSLEGDMGYSCDCVSKMNNTLSVSFSLAITQLIHTKRQMQPILSILFCWKVSYDVCVCPCRVLSKCVSYFAATSIFLGSS